MPYYVVFKMISASALPFGRIKVTKKQNLSGIPKSGTGKLSNHPHLLIYRTTCLIIAVNF
jgi:hypothetical protein